MPPASGVGPARLYRARGMSRGRSDCFFLCLVCVEIGLTNFLLYWILPDTGQAVNSRHRLSCFALTHASGPVWHRNRLFFSRRQRQHGRSGQRGAGHAGNPAGDDCGFSSGVLPSRSLRVVCRRQDRARCGFHIGGIRGELGCPRSHPLLHMCLVCRLCGTSASRPASPSPRPPSAAASRAAWRDAAIDTQRCGWLGQGAGALRECCVPPPPLRYSPLACLCAQATQIVTKATLQLSGLE